MIRSNPTVTLYTVPDCSECQHMRIWLARSGVRFAEQRLLDTLGSACSGPLTVLGERVLTGSVVEQKRIISEAMASSVRI